MPELIHDKTTELKDCLVSLVQHAPFGIVAIDHQGFCTIANDQIAQVFQCEASDMIGHDFCTLCEPLPELQCIVDASLVDGSEDFEIAQLVSADQCYGVRGRVIANGQLIVFDNITARVESENLQAHLFDKLSQANRDLKEFAYISAHDMKSPVASLSGLIEEMADCDAVKSENLELFEMVRNSVANMRHTVRGLNEVLKLKQTFTDDRGPCDTQVVFDDVRHGISQLLRTSHTTLDVQLASCPGFPMSSFHLHSVLQNLLSNAVKYARPGEPPAIRVEASREDERSVLTVSDNGLGMDLERCGEKLFGLFNRFHTHVDGAGIGLYSIRAIAQSYAGHITVESRPNHGSTFRMEIPHA